MLKSMAIMDYYVGQGCVTWMLGKTCPKLSKGEPRDECDG